MRHFDHLNAEARSRIFALQPQPVDIHAATVGAALGATLYTPATCPDLASRLARQRARGVVSMVLDLEDAVRDQDVAAGEAAIADAMDQAQRDSLEIPLIYIRPRRAEQIPTLARSSRGMIAGFALPKCDTAGAEMLDTVADTAERQGLPLLAMPIIEGKDVAHIESRRDSLTEMSRLIEKHPGMVPCIRIGGTDLSGTFGLRRGPDLTVWELAVVRDAIADIINVFARADSPAPVVTGCVWEHFDPSSRVLKPHLRTSPFASQGDRGQRLRANIIAADGDALVREVVLDKANGLIGKTVIHPSHVPIVHSLLAVTAEEHHDAEAVVAVAGGGAVSSGYRNKMNERGPHRLWAQRVLHRAAAFGVLREGKTFADLLAAHEAC